MTPPFAFNASYLSAVDSASCHLIQTLLFTAFSATAILGSSIFRASPRGPPTPQDVNIKYEINKYGNRYERGRYSVQIRDTATRTWDLSPDSGADTSPGGESASVLVVACARVGPSRELYKKRLTSK